MKLSEYLKKTRMGANDFARVLGLPPWTIRRYLGGRIPSAEYMQMIHGATKGLVTPNDFHGVTK